MLASLQTNQTLNQANTQTNERNNNEHQDQGVRSDYSDKRAYPRDSRSDDSGNGFQNGSNSDSSSRENIPLFLKEFNILRVGHPLTMNINNALEKENHNRKEKESNKIADRLRQEEVGELNQEPQDEIFHRLHRTAKPPLRIQNRTTRKIAQEQSHG